ncbi:MAG: DUF2780 domain-containing protein [Planctomycetaceae bacterium]
MGEAVVEEFISLVTKQLGIDEGQSRSATGGILNVIKGQLDDSTFSSVLKKLPGADALLNEAQSGGGKSGGGGGLMGSLTSMAGSLLGGNAGGVAGITKAIGDSGIGLDKASGFLSLLVNFLKEKLGDDMFSKLAAKLPGLISGGK